jgi:hypothetical protein
MAQFCGAFLNELYLQVMTGRVDIFSTLFCNYVRVITSYSRTFRKQSFQFVVYIKEKNRDERKT